MQASKYLNVINEFFIFVQWLGVKFAQNHNKTSTIASRRFVFSTPSLSVFFDKVQKKVGGFV